MTVTADQISGLLIKGIQKLAYQYTRPADEVELLFRINEKKQLLYIALHQGQPLVKTNLRYLIGLNTYNFLVERRIKKLIRSLSEENGIELATTALVAKLQNDETVNIFLYNKTEFIKPLSLSLFAGQVEEEENEEADASEDENVNEE